jgi:hypothetical protein
MLRGLAAWWTGMVRHAGGLIGADVVGVGGLAEEGLPGEGAVRPLGDDHLGALGLGRDAVGADGRDVLLDGQLG